MTTAPTPTDPRRRTGELGELAARLTLERNGAEVLRMNARTRYGELDIVAWDQGCLVFVEVKTVRAGNSRGPLRPLESIGPRKQAQVRRLARAWLAENSPGRSYREIRFDAIGVVLDRSGEPLSLEWIEAAF